MNRPMTRQEWLSYIEQTWDAAQKEAWSEQPHREQPQQEPVAWNLRYNRYPREGDLLADIHLLRWQETLPQSLNTPPRREWQGLTEEDILRTKGQFKGTLDVQFDKFARAIEAKLKEKNA